MDFDVYVRLANEAISPLDYEILSIQHQVNKERIWALVNSVSDPITQMATTRTSEEIFYIKRFLDAMFETNNTKRKEVMAVSSMQALEGKIRRGAPQSGDEAGTQAVDKGLTGDQVEKLLVKLTTEKWLDKSREGFLRLAPRALMELRSWLIDTYNEPDEPDEWQRIKFCVACREIVTVGQRCADQDCLIRLHSVCEDAYWRANPNKACPRCKTAWDGKHLVGQKVITNTDDYLRDRRKSGGNKRSREVEEEEAEDEDEPESVDRRRRSRSQQAEPNGGPSRRRKVPEPESEPEEEEEEGDEGEAVEEDEGELAEEELAEEDENGEEDNGDEDEDPEAEEDDE